MMILTSYTLSTLLALASFTFVASVTPGPNNLMLLHSGARFGFYRTIPHMLGISVGFMVMVFFCCIGVAAVIFGYSATSWILKAIGCIYMLWLSYKLYKNGAIPMDGHLPENKMTRQMDHAAQPMTLMQAALFQYVNPKAWLMALTLPVAYLPAGGSLWVNTLIACLLCVSINLISVSVWARGGELLQAILHRPNWARVANWSIVLMTVYCALSVW